MGHNINLIKPKYYSFESNGTTIDVMPCSFKVLKLIDFEEKSLINSAFEILNNNLQDTYVDAMALGYERCASFVVDYIKWLNSVRDSEPSLQVPQAKYYKPKSDFKIDFEMNFDSIKLIADYAKINFFEVYELNYFDYCALLHDAVIDVYSQSEKGREYLHNCFLEKQTDIDSDGLASLFKNGKLGGNN